MEAKKDVGAIWRRTSKDGKEYLSIQFSKPDGTKSEFIAFLNNKDGVDKRPDYKIYHSTPREERSSPAPSQPTPTTQNKPDDGDIPF